jgi:hypothetical protein
MKETDERIEYVVMCRECEMECYWGKNDLDSFNICPKCEKTDFHGELKTKNMKKVTRYTTEIEYIDEDITTVAGKPTPSGVG